MTQPSFTLESLDLAALLCSKVCHDVISPVGAIVNGLEVLEDDGDQDTREFALDLIKKSAGQASAKLQFCRLAYGAAGSAGAAIDTGDAEAVARGLFGDDKIRLEWTVPRVLMPKNLVKLLLNLTIIAAGTIPRGGSIRVGMTGPAEQPQLELRATGPSPRVNAALSALLAGEVAGKTLDAHAIQPYFTGLVARQVGFAVSLTQESDGVLVSARSSEAAVSEATDLLSSVA